MLSIKSIKFTITEMCIYLLVFIKLYRFLFLYSSILRFFGIASVPLSPPLPPLLLLSYRLQDNSPLPPPTIYPTSSLLLFVFHFLINFHFLNIKKRRFPIKKNLYFDGFLRLYHKHIFALYFEQKKRKRNKNKNIECIGAVTG